MRSPGPFCCSLLLAGAATAQGLALIGADHAGGALREDTWVRARSLGWPAGLEGRTTRVLAARLSGAAVPDVVMLVDSTPVLVVAPAIDERAGVLLDAGGIADAAVLRGRGRTTDAIALVGEDGLAIVPGGAAVGEVERVGGEEWRDVTLLATHPTDTDVVFGIAASGRCVVATRSVATGRFTTAATTFAVPGTPIAAVCIDWDGDGTAELAMATTAGLELRRRDGSVLATRPDDADGSRCVAMTRVTTATNATRESLARLTRDGYGLQRVQITSAVERYELALLTGKDFVGIVAGDWNADGNDELVLSTAENVDVTLLLNHARPAPYDALADFVYDGSTAVEIAVAERGERIANTAGCAVADFDGDGDDDIVVAHQPGPDRPEGTTFVACARPFGSFEHPTLTREVDAATGYAEESRSWTCRLELPGRGTVAGQTHTRVVVWKESACGLVRVAERLAPNPDRPEPITVVLPVDIQHVMAGGTYVCLRQAIAVCGDAVSPVEDARLQRIHFNLFHDRAPDTHIDPGYDPYEEPLPPPTPPMFAPD